MAIFFPSTALIFTFQIVNTRAQKAKQTARSPASSIHCAGPQDNVPESAGMAAQAVSEHTDSTGGDISVEFVDLPLRDLKPWPPR
jgi:hypothetical protein